MVGTGQGDPGTQKMPSAGMHRTRLLHRHAPHAAAPHSPAKGLNDWSSALSLALTSMAVSSMATAVFNQFQSIQSVPSITQCNGASRTVCAGRGLSTRAAAGCPPNKVRHAVEEHGVALSKRRWLPDMTLPYKHRTYTERPLVQRSSHATDCAAL